MAIWPFNRKRNQSEDIPQEVQDYYQAEKREKVGVAGLLALGTLLVTVVLSMGLFFGGRWAYRAVFDKDEAPQTAQQSSQDEEEADEPVPATTGNEAGEDEDRPAVTTPPTTSSPTPGAGSTGTTTSGNNAGLPSAGPGDTAIIAMSAVLFASSAYYVFGGKKQLSR